MLTRLRDWWDTGVDGSDAALATNVGNKDTHYTLTLLDSSTPDPYAIRHSAWASNSATSGWIGPSNGITSSPAAGKYVYTLTFNVTNGTNTWSIVGNWGADNADDATTENGTINNKSTILINGVDTGQNLEHWLAAFQDPLKSFTIAPGHFVEGTNTLDFVVWNGGSGPTGLRVEGIRAVPTPSGLVMLLGLGCVGLIGIWRKRRRSAG